MILSVGTVEWYNGWLPEGTGDATIMLVFAQTHPLKFLSHSIPSISLPSGLTQSHSSTTSILND